MASVATPSLKLEKQGTAENAGTWGTKRNVDLDTLDAAIAGTLEITTTGGDTTLADSDFTTDQAKYKILKIVGTLASAANIIVPSLSRTYIVRNATSGAHGLTIKTSAGAGVTVSQGHASQVIVDAAIDDVVHLDTLRADIASTANGFGASLVGIEDSGGLITATTVEGALAENRAAIDAIEADYLTSGAIGVSVQAHDADLTTWAGLTPSANAQSLVTAADYAAMRGLLDLEIGVDLQAYDAGLSDIAGLAVTDGNIIVGDGANWVAESGATARASLGLTIGTHVQAYDAKLADIVGMTFAQGDVIYYNGTNLVNLAPGVAGQVLQTQGAGANPQWATAAGSGDVSAASNFGTDNVLVRSDGTLKGVQATGIAVDDSGNVSGVNNVTGADANFVTGTAGTSGNLVSWDASGDAVDSTYAVVDEDDMASDSATKVPTQQSVKAYVDTAIGGVGGGINPNILINGDGAINQRSASTGIDDDEYFCDRHYALVQSNDVTFSSVTDAADGVPQMIRLTQAALVVKRFGAAQIVSADASKIHRGGSVTLSGKVRCSASTTIRWAILEWTGTADAVTSDVVNDWGSGTYTAGNFFLSSNLTVSGTGSDALVANTITDFELTASISSSCNNIVVMIWTSSTQAQNVTLDWRWKLEPGANATDWVVRQTAVEIALCQTYHYRVTGLVNAYVALAPKVGTAVNTATVPLPVTMRRTPDFTYSFGATKARVYWYGGGFQNVDAATLTAFGGTLAFVRCEMAADVGAGHGNLYFAASDIALIFDAEL